MELRERVVAMLREDGQEKKIDALSTKVQHRDRPICMSVEAAVFRTGFQGEGQYRIPAGTAFANQHTRRTGNPQ